METGYTVTLAAVLVLCVLHVLRLVAACDVILIILVLYTIQLLLNVVTPFYKETTRIYINTVNHTAGLY